LTIINVGASTVSFLHCGYAICLIFPNEDRLPIESVLKIID
jgi:hypothetical protein